MKYNLKNPLWYRDPHKARELLEKELREMLDNAISCGIPEEDDLLMLIKEILEDE